MKTNLNELVDAVFKGVILVIASSLVTLVVFLVRPKTGIRRLLAGMRGQATEEVTPRVLVFLPMMSVMLSPIFMSQLSHPAGMPDDGCRSI